MAHSPKILQWGPISCELHGGEAVATPRYVTQKDLRTTAWVSAASLVGAGRQFLLPMLVPLWYVNVKHTQLTPPLKAEQKPKSSSLHKTIKNHSKYQTLSGSKEVELALAKRTARLTAATKAS